ncbi:DNA (cytosine-5)-methyltransferase DRM1 [Platanthera guangdongensis]|uniref:DNA (Cytosine-5)-methyltransferase DRM1 n=1 Tax=Platanthera guangdongensis TaxID=2320717 RepID=A0ABR2MGN7_9ASPA
MFQNGINVLSLFSDVDGAEVTLQKLGIHLNMVVFVEKSKLNRNIVMLHAIWLSSLLTLLMLTTHWTQGGAPLL